VACEIHKDQPGIVLQHFWTDCFGTIVNIAAAVTLTLKFKRPSGSVFTVIAIMPGGGVDGIEQYTSLAATFNEAGLWKRQWYTNVTGWSDIFEFTVKDNLCLVGDEIEFVDKDRRRCHERGERFIRVETQALMERLQENKS
jgi:hypothetical protein